MYLRSSIDATDAACSNPVDSFLKSKETHSPTIGGDTDEEAQRRGFLEDAGEEDGDESFDDRPMREIRAGGGEGRGFAGIGERDGGDGDDDDDGSGAGDDDKYRKKARPHDARSEAIPLFDADFETSESAGRVSETSNRPAPHSYPPVHPPRAAATALPSDLPRYTPYEAQSDGAAEGWDDEWSGSDTTHSRPSSPAPAVSGAGVASTSPSASPPDAPQSEAPIPLSAATTSVRAEATSDRPSASSWATRTGGSSSDGGDVEHEWSFEQEEDGAQATLAPSSSATSRRQTSVLAAAGDPFAPSSSLPIRSELPASFAYTPSPAPESDDWGLDLDESGPPEAPVTDSVQGHEALWAEPAIVAAGDSRTAGQRHAQEEDTGPDHGDANAHTSDDDWGFQEEQEATAVQDNILASPVHLPSSTNDDTIETVGETLREGAGVAHSSSPLHAPASPEDGGDSDDWGFRGSQDEDRQIGLKDDLT